MKILSVRNVVASLILAISTSALAAPVTLTIGNVFDLSNNGGELSPPITTSTTVSFDLSNYSVSGYTRQIDFNSYRDVTTLSFTAPDIQFLNQVPDFNPAPVSSVANSGVNFYTESVRINGDPAQLERAYFLAYYSQRIYSQSGALTQAVEYSAVFEINNHPNPNYGSPAQFLASVRQSPLSISSSSYFYFSTYDEVGKYGVDNEYRGSAQLQASNEVPEPASLLLLISGLLGALLFGRGTGRSASVATA